MEVNHMRRTCSIVALVFGGSRQIENTSVVQASRPPAIARCANYEKAPGHEQESASLSSSSPCCSTCTAIVHLMASSHVHRMSFTHHKVPQRESRRVRSCTTCPDFTPGPRNLTSSYTYTHKLRSTWTSQRQCKPQRGRVRSTLLSACGSR